MIFETPTSWTRFNVKIEAACHPANFARKSEIVRKISARKSSEREAENRRGENPKKYPTRNSLVHSRLAPFRGTWISCNTFHYVLCPP